MLKKRLFIVIGITLFVSGGAENSGKIPELRFPANSPHLADPALLRHPSADRPLTECATDVEIIDHYNRTYCRTSPITTHYHLAFHHYDAGFFGQIVLAFALETSPKFLRQDRDTCRQLGMISLLKKQEFLLTFKIIPSFKL